MEKKDILTNNGDPDEMARYELSPGSTLFAILILILTDTPIKVCNNVRVQNESK